MKITSLIFFSIISFGFSQTYDPITGELISEKKLNEQIQYDPITGEKIGVDNNKNIFQINKKIGTNSDNQNKLNVRELAFRDANNNFNTQLTWSILGGGISYVSIIPISGLGIAIGGDELAPLGLMGGIYVGLFGVPKLLAANESEPSNFVLEQNKIETFSKSQKQQYISIYSRGAS